MPQIRPISEIARLTAALLVLAAIVMISTNPASAAGPFKTTPMKHGRDVWRIGFYEGGPYFNYRRNLEAFAHGLVELGWMDPVAIPEGAPDDTLSVWRYLARNASSEYLRFEEQAYWSADWDAEKRAANRTDCIWRLVSGEVDFMLVAGTWAGQDLATDEHSVPMTVCAVSDPVRSGIVESPERSGRRHVHAKCDPDRYRRMVRLFRTIVPFQRLGITYEDSPEGRSHAAVEDVYDVARELGFEVTACTAPFAQVTQEQSTDAVVACQKHLAKRADAVIIPVHRGVTTHRMSEILAPLIHGKIPTFSQQGALEVRHGVLMGMTLGQEAFHQIGLFHAKVAASAFNGLWPGELPLVFEDPRSMVFNMETARRIGFQPPPTLVEVADEVYETIEADTP